MGRRRETLKERLNRPGRTRAGRLIRGAIRLATPAVAAAGMLFPAAQPLVVGAAARIRAAKSHIRERVEARQAEHREATQALEQGVPEKAVSAYAGILSFFRKIPIWVWVLIPGLLILGFLLNRGKRNTQSRGNTPRKEKNAPTSLKSGKKRKSKPKSASASGFARRIGDIVYTDPKAWGAAMKKRRKK